MLRSALKAMIPEPVLTKLRNVKLAFTPHDKIYNEHYFEEEVIDTSSIGAPIMSSTLYDWRRPKTVIDIGCGSGALLAAFRELGCEVEGFEYANVGLAYCRGRKIPTEKFDISVDRFPQRRADLVVSFEVAEHLAPRYADRYVELLCSMSADIAMSAATPGQGGTGHINEQPHSYWIEKFRQRGYFFLADISQKLSQEWCDANIASWYCNNVMVFSPRS